MLSYYMRLYSFLQFYTTTVLLVLTLPQHFDEEVRNGSDFKKFKISDATILDFVATPLPMSKT